MWLEKSALPRFRLRSTLRVLIGLALLCASLSTGCIPDDGSNGESVESTVTDFSNGWPTKDSAVVQACMDLDPSELISSLPPEYIINPTYCQADSDCYCQSGSGVPFVGCANAYHARISFGGCYACDACVCIDNACQLH